MVFDVYKFLNLKSERTLKFFSICNNQYNFDKYESYAVKSNETLTGLKALNIAIPLRRRGGLFYDSDSLIFHSLLHHHQDRTLLSFFLSQYSTSTDTRKAIIMSLRSPLYIQTRPRRLQIWIYHCLIFT